MATEQLPAQQLDAVRTALLEVLGYDAATRGALLTGLPVAVRGLLPGGQAAPAIGLALDLGFLNGIGRLADGTVPIKVLLERAVSLAGPIEAADVVRDALSEVEARTSGAPPVVVAGLPELKEAVVLRDDMVPFGFLHGGLAAARAVAKLMVTRHDDGRPTLVSGKPVVHLGTGWLVAPGLLMTNHHVVAARAQGDAPPSAADLRAQAVGMTVLFDYDDDATAGTAVEAVELVAADPGLDYALVRLADAGRPPLTLSTEPVAAVSPGQEIAINVIQHPDGRSKRFALRNNVLTAATPTELRYLTDTLGGSSGSPLLDDTWQVVGLHRGSTFVSGVQFQGRRVACVNVGTPITAVLAHAGPHLPGPV